MIDIIARGMIEESNGDISQISEKVNNHTEDSDIHVTTTDKENWNSHPNDVQAEGNPVIMDGLQGGVPFAEMVVVSGDDIIGQDLTVNVCGKNLIPPDYMTQSGTYRGVTVNVKDDGRVDITGTATSEGYILTILTNYPLIGGKKYTLNCSKQYDVNTFNFAFVIRDKNGNWKYALKSYPATIVADEGDYISAWRLWAYNGVEYSAKNVEIQMEIGDIATEYKTPVRSTTTITPDSNPYTIPNDIRQVDGLNNISVSAGEISVTGVRKNAAVKKIWDEMGMGLLFDGVTSADNPAVVDLANYKFVEIHHIMIANGKTYPSNIRLSLDSYLSSTSTITIPIVSSAINTIHTEEGTISSLYAISAAGGNMNNTKIYGIK